MGSLCSKQSALSGGHVVLGSASDENSSNPRAAAAEAAERRQKSAQARGTNISNPNRGQLAAQLQAAKSSPAKPDARQEERIVWD